MYKFKNVGKSIILFQCKISKRILIPLRKTSFKKIGIMALSKDRERADNTSKKDKNATKKNTRLKFVLSKESAFIKVFILVLVSKFSLTKTKSKNRK